LERKIDTFSSFGEHESINIGDTAILIDNKMALLSERDYTFRDSIREIGSKIIVAGKRLTINGVPIIKDAKSRKWYKEENFRKLYEKEFENVDGHIRKYEQFDFDDISDEELFGKSNDEIKVGDLVKLIEPNALYVNGKLFRTGSLNLDEKYKVVNIDIEGNFILIRVAREIDTAFGHISHAIIAWYDINCFKKIT